MHGNPIQPDRTSMKYTKSTEANRSYQKKKTRAEKKSQKKLATSRSLCQKIREKGPKKERKAVRSVAWGIKDQEREK